MPKQNEVAGVTKEIRTGVTSNKLAGNWALVEDLSQNGCHLGAPLNFFFTCHNAKALKLINEVVNVSGSHIMGIMSCRNFLLIIRKGGNQIEVSRLVRALAEKTTFKVAPLRCLYPHLLLQRYEIFARWPRGNPYLCVGKSLFVSREIPTRRREIPILVAPATPATHQRPTTKRGNRSGNVAENTMKNTRPLPCGRRKSPKADPNPTIRRASFKAACGRGALPFAERWRAPRALHRLNKNSRPHGLLANQNL